MPGNSHAWEQGSSIYGHQGQTKPCENSHKAPKSPGRLEPPRQSTKFIGVEMSGNRYTAHIRVRDKDRFIGWFPTSIEAAKAYDEMAIQIFRERALTNFVRQADESVPVFGFGLTEAECTETHSCKQGRSEAKPKKRVQASIFKIKNNDSHG